MHHVSFEPFLEGLFLRDLYFGEPGALEMLHAIGDYNDFLERNAQYYSHPQSLARVAVLSDTTDAVVPYLNQISEQNLNYDIIFNYQSPREKSLTQYKIIVLPNTNPLGIHWCAAFAAWVRRHGGTLIAVQDASLFSPGPASTKQDFGLGELLGISKENIPGSTVTRRRGKGLAIYLPDLPPAGELVSLLRFYLKKVEVVEVEPRNAILSNFVYQPEYRRVVLHLLNYRQELEKGIRVHVRMLAKRAEILSPDQLNAAQALVQTYSGGSDIFVPELQTYNLLAIYPSEKSEVPLGLR